MPDEVSTQARRYGAELARLLAETGQTQASLVKAVYSSQAAVSRYLSGRRIAPQTFLDAFAGFVRGCGVELSEEQFAQLTELRKQAQRASNGAATQVLYWQELTDQLKAEVNKLREELGQAREELATRELETQSLTAAREEAARLAARLTTAEAALSEARTRAEAAEADRDQLADQAAGQQDQLEHAASYSRTLERDLAGEQERVKALQRELHVLQRQVQRLLDEQPDTVPEAGKPAEAVPVSSLTTSSDVALTQAEAGQPSAVPATVPMPDWQPAPVVRWRPEAELPYTGHWPSYYDDIPLAPQSDLIAVLRTAWEGFKKDLKTIRRRLQVPFHVRAPQRITDWLHRSTGDSRWLVIGESIEALQDYDRGYGPTGIGDPRAALANPPAFELTMDTVTAYRHSVAQLRIDLNKLADLHAERQG